jgi:hypothetical protein
MEIIIKTYITLIFLLYLHVLISCEDDSHYNVKIALCSFEKTVQNDKNQESFQLVSLQNVCKSDTLKYKHCKLSKYILTEDPFHFIC